MTTEPAGKGGKRPLRIGKYEVLHHIASGGMGSVYKAIDVENSRDVALKVLPLDLAANPKVLERFRREAQAASRLRHDNVVAIYECGEAAGTHFLAMEFVHGTNLQEYIEAHGPFKPEVARDLLKQAAKALAHVHSQGIVHRDIKPSNFLLTEQDGRFVLKLTDLGLALRGDEDLEARVTKEGTTVGTVDYMSPEQAHDSRSADARSDIYSLGCTFYHMLGGHAPFHEGSLIERLTRHVSVEPPDIRKLNAEVPEDLVYVLDRMLKKKPEQRYQTPLEILRDLLNPEQIDFGPRLEPLDPPTTPSLKRRETSPEIKRKPLVPADKPGSSPSATSLPTRDRPVAVKTRDDESVPMRRSGDEIRPRARTSRKVAGSQWFAFAAIAAGLLVLASAIIIVLLMARGETPPRSGEQTEPTNRYLTPDSPRKRADGGPKMPMGIEFIQEMPRLDPGPFNVYGTGFQFDPAKLQHEFEGPLALPQSDSTAVHFTVGRLLPKTAVSFPTLAEALAAAPAGARTVITIADAGPIFVPELPPVTRRNLVIRGDKGFMPLLVWEASLAKSSTLLAVHEGNLTLIDLELAVRWNEPSGQEPLTFVRLTGGDFLARHCVFSAAGKHPRGFVLARLDADKVPAKCRLSRCYARGADLQILHLTGQGWDAEIDDSLLVSGAATALASDCPPQAPLTVRVLRSSVTTGKHFLQLQTPPNLDVQPAVRVKLLDALVAHCDPMTEGGLLVGTGQMETFNMTWRAANVVYAGWHKLLSAANQSIRGGDLEAWRRQWSTADGDKTVPEAWPRSLPPDIEEAAAGYYALKGSRLWFAAISHSGVLGAPLAQGAAYTPREGWIALTSERFALAATPLPSGEMLVIAPAEDGLYHGEAIALTWDTDLGSLLEKRLSENPGKVAPRVVLELSGTGEVRTSTLRVKGFDLVLQVPVPADPKEKPLTLVPRSTTADQAALIDVENGSLEMINVRILCDNKDVPLPRSLIRVKGGDLRLFGCTLQGPLDKGPANYERLIEFHGSGKKELAAAHQLACSQTVLISGKQVLGLIGGGAHVRSQQCVALAAEDLMELDPGSVQGHANVQVALQNSTLAVRRNAFHVNDPPASAGPWVEPILVQADKNLFVDPFIEGPRTSCLLDLTPRALSLGVIQWQGTGNGFDERWSSLVPAVGMSLPAWQRLWGRVGERGAAIVTWPAAPPSTFALGTPQLQRLQPPRQWQEYGADLLRLGIGKKK
jgi:serine/threonine-protein kinase